MAKLLHDHYFAFLYPFEQMYKRNLHDQQKKLQMSQTQGSLVEQQFAGSSGLPRQNVGMPPNLQQSGIRPMSSNGITPQSMPTTNGMGQFMQMGNQQRPPLASSDSHGSVTPSDLDAFPQTVDANILDQDSQGIKRKHDSDDVDIKRVRQKTGQCHVCCHIQVVHVFSSGRSPRWKSRM